MDIEAYLTERVEDQIEYFDSNALRNQKKYKFFKVAAITCNVLTTLTIALALTFMTYLKVLGITALILSTIVLATYQIEEFCSFGSKWEKFRLVAERMKSEKYLFLNSVGMYSSIDTDEKERLFIKTIESIIQGTDMSYFSLMIEPGKRIEKRL